MQSGSLSRMVNGEFLSTKLNFYESKNGGNPAV